MRSAFLFLPLALFMLACPDPVENPTPTPIDRPETELLAYYNADDPGRGLAINDESTVQTVRFELDTPAQIWGVRVYFARVDDPTTTTVRLWPDFGYNYYDYDVENPLQNFLGKIVWLDTNTDESLVRGIVVVLLGLFPGIFDVLDFHIEP